MATDKGRWPFPGDAPVARSRKMALAYRQVARDRSAQYEQLLRIIARVDERIVGWIDDEDFKHLYTAATSNITDPVTELDRRFIDWGETWHADIATEHFDDDAWISTAQAAEILHISPNGMSALRARGRISHDDYKVVRDGGRLKYYYLAGAVYRLQKQRPRTSRSGTSTDKVDDNGRSDLT